jgi:DNA repair protein SbcC/Rad50
MKIRIKKLTLVNFKGIKLHEILFVNNSTNIYGDNATDKTTLMDAFLWLLFGKDSTDRKDFEIKTLDHKGAIIPKIEHEVSAVIEVDGIEYNIKRILKEKWVTKRGSKDAEFSGNETVYFWNDVPLQLKDYQAKINGLVNEDVFKLLTNVLYFNQLDWQKRRSVLTQIAGDITDGEIAATNPEFKALLDRLLTERKTFSEFKSQLSAQKKNLKTQLEAIPTRIDEAHRGMPEQIDFDAIQKAIDEKNIELNKIEESLLDASKTVQANMNLVLGKQSEIQKLKTDRQQVEFDIKQKFQDQKNERQKMLSIGRNDVDQCKNQVDLLTNNLRAFRKQLAELETERARLRDQWAEENEKELVFDDKQFCCPACKRSFEAADIEAKKKELTNNFNINKTVQLDRIKERGVAVASDIETFTKRIASTESELEAAEDKLTASSHQLNDVLKQVDEGNKNAEADLQLMLESDSRLKSIAGEISSLEEQVGSLKAAPADDNEELKVKKAGITCDIDALKSQLALKEQIEKVKQRIQQLHEEESKLAQQVADLEGIEFTIQNFEKAKIEALEAKVNSMFSFVKFRMFETQINGGEVPCCHTLVNSNGAWVPFSDANNAAKINAGLDIINRLSQHYNVQCPVFIDNRESVTSLINTDTQLVNLIVSPEDKKLRVA